MNIELEQIKLLREKTGAGMLACKNTLAETAGDFDQAVTLLRKKGLASAEKKASRVASQGVVASYIHIGFKVGVLIELNCETDFVARKLEFQNLAKTLAMQVAANETVQYISLEDVPESVWASEIKIESEREDLQQKNEKARESIVKGRVEKTLKTLTLLSQPCIRDLSLSVDDYIKSHVSLFGENIKIKRFSKFILGQK